jgi:hypothetical protein
MYIMCWNYYMDITQACMRHDNVDRSQLACKEVDELIWNWTAFCDTLLCIALHFRALITVSDSAIIYINSQIGK